MKICCPSCNFTGNVPDDKVIAQGVFATCPKCRTRFEITASPVPAPQVTVVCPKCAVSQESGDICISCGIVFSKYLKAQEMKEQALSDPQPDLPPVHPESGQPGNKVVLLAAALSLLAAVWFFYTPHLAVRSMRAAAQERDAAKLSSRVNFPALKESLKASFNAKIAAETAKEKESNPFAALGAAMAAAFISPLIDALVTPESLAMIMQGDKPQLGMGKKDAPKAAPDTETSMSYESLNSFVVTIKKKNDTQEPVGLVFNRDGLFSSWKLSAIRLPL